LLFVIVQFLLTRIQVMGGRQYEERSVEVAAVPC